MRLEGLSDEELIGIVKSKNENFNSALGILYTKYYNSLCGYSKSILGSREDAEDNVNDVFCKVFLESGHIHNYKEEGNFKSWILSITHNTAISKLRKRNLQNRFLEENVNEFHASPENNIYSNENREIVRKELKQIGDIHSDILYLREFFDMDYNEIEKSLDILSSTCRGRYIRAVDLLKRNLIDKYGEEQFLS